MPTDWNHAFTVVVQILHHSLTQTINLSLAALGSIARQEPFLLLQPAHQIGQFLRHALVRTEILLLGQDKAKVEDEFIAVVLR